MRKTKLKRSNLKWTTARHRKKRIQRETDKRALNGKKEFDAYLWEGRQIRQLPVWHRTRRLREHNMPQAVKNTDARRRKNIPDSPKLVAPNPDVVFPPAPNVNDILL